MAKAPILLATTNPAKQEKLRWLLRGLDLLPRTLEELDLSHRPPPDEDGPTHLVIASAKALAWSQAASMLTISSDGGLDIPALGQRWQSVLTHRLVGEGNDEDKVHQLLELLEGYRGDGRRARWVEALAIAEAGRVTANWQVEGATGYVAETPGPLAGTQGFWAFSVWHLPKYGKCYNALSQEELAAVDDHWTQLRRLVRAHFQTKPEVSG